MMWLGHLAHDLDNHKSLVELHGRDGHATKLQTVRENLSTNVQNS
jgi:hypothetical protein